MVTNAQFKSKSKKPTGNLIQLTAALEALNHAGFIVIDHEWRFVYMNATAEVILRQKRADLIGQPVLEIFPEITKADNYPQIIEAVKNRIPFSFETFNTAASRWFRINLNPFETGVVVTLREISTGKRMETELFQRLRQQETVANLGLRALAGADIDSILEEALQLLSQVLNVEFVKVSEVLPNHKLLLRAGLGWKTGLVGSYTALADTSTQSGYTLTIGKPVIVNDLKSETRFSGPPLLWDHEVRSGVTVIIGDKATYGVLGVHSQKPRHFTQDDINFLQAVANILATVFERKKFEETIKHHIYHDSLTGLPNRKLLNDRLEAALNQSKKTNRLLAVMFLDLDRFKNINDTIGHYVGDKILKEAGRRLTTSLGESALVARLGGDEFIILLNDIDGPQTCIETAEKIFAALKPEFKIDDYDLHLSASIGITLFPYDGKDVNTLLKNADTALYRAKDAGRNNYQLYNKAMDMFANEKLNLETQLRRAIEQKEFILYYQPIIDINTNQIVSFEALVRWDNPQIGLMSPREFIPLAEETGLILPLGELISDLLCDQLKIWKTKGLSGFRASLNLSPRQFRQENLCQKILDRFTAAQLEFNQLEIEITESIAMESIDQNIQKLTKLKQKGVQIVIDDFGTGHSSLNYLRRLPISKLKIDKSFIADCHTNQEDGEIVKTIVTLAHNLKLKVVAEGVETVDQFRFLELIGCDEVQGYLVGRPLPASGVDNLILKRSSRSAPDDTDFEGQAFEA